VNRVTTHVVTLTYLVAFDEDDLVRLAELIENEADGSVAAVPGRGVSVTLWIEGFDVVKAPAIAADTADRLVGAEPSVVEVMTEDEYLRRSDEPTLPELLSAPEVADVLAVSRQRVHQLRSLRAFPKPLVELRTGPIWDARAIQRFASEWKRKPGRPKFAAIQTSVWETGSGPIREHEAGRAAEDESGALTVAEVATKLRVSKMTVYRLVHGGELHALRVGRSFRVTEQALHEYQQRQRAVG
jgi:excisionase family DNA binding protein